MTDGGNTRLESSFDANGIQVRVSIKRLRDDERKRIAAEVAWFTDLLLTPGVDADAVGWTSFLQRMLDDVAITVDDGAVEQLQPLWDLVLWRVLRAYIDANGLDACLKQWLHGGLHDPHVNNRTKSAG